MSDRGVATWALFILSIVFSSAHGWGETSVSLRLAAGGLPIVPVFLGGRGPYDFVLDTGASCTLVDDGLGRMLGLAPLARTRLSTVNGSRAAERVRLETLSIGPLRVRNLLALSTELSEIRARDRRVAGVLGYDVLSQSPFLLDFGARTVSWVPRERIQGVPVTFDDSGRRVRLTLGSQRFVLDTAATKMVLFQREGPPLGPGVRRDLRSLSRISTVDGSRLARAGSVRGLAAGSRTFRDVPVVLVPRNGVPGAFQEDGLLPARLFERIYVDPERRDVMFDPSVAPEDHLLLGQALPLLQ